MTRSNQIGISNVILLCALMLCSRVSSEENQGSTRLAREPESYQTLEMSGWTIVVNRQLLDEKSEHYELGQQVQRVLSSHLTMIQHRLPQAAVDKLRTVKIWLEVSEESPPCAAYHPSREWLVEHSVNPDKAKCVEIANARRFVEWTRTQPAMVLHELSHAYHDQFVDGGFRNSQIRGGWETAVAAELYGDVLHADGELRESYAATNEKEFFAELSESFFGTNDFYPFVNAELKKHDPASHALIESIWQGDLSK